MAGDASQDSLSEVLGGRFNLTTLVEVCMGSKCSSLKLRVGLIALSVCQWSSAV